MGRDISQRRQHISMHRVIVFLSHIGIRIKHATKRECVLFLGIRHIHFTNRLFCASEVQVLNTRFRWDSHFVQHFQWDSHSQWDGLFALFPSSLLPCMQFTVDIYETNLGEVQLRPSEPMSHGTPVNLAPMKGLVPKPR